MSTTKNTVKIITGEILGQSVAYLAGLLASMAVSSFFVKKSIKNGWGLFSKKEVVDGETFNWLIFVSSYLIGLLALILVSRIMKTLFADNKVTSDQP